MVLIHSITEEDVERRNFLAKSCPNCVRNSLLEDQNHSIVSKMRLLTNTPSVHLTSMQFYSRVELLTLLLIFIHVKRRRTRIDL